MRNKGFLGKVAACVSFALAAAACGPGKPASGPGGRVAAAPACPPVAQAKAPTLHLPGGPFLDFPNPFQYNLPSYSIVANIYDSLLLVDSKDRLLPWLATGYKRSPDGLTYTFELKDGVKWSDGKPFTADDVAFTYQVRMGKLRPDLIAKDVESRPDHLIGAKATTPNSVELTLDKPINTFLRTVVAKLPIAPQHVWSNYHGAVPASDPALLVGTGPLSLQPGNGQSGQEGQFRFKAKEDFFLGKPIVSGVDYVPVGDTLASLETGQIDGGAVNFLQGLNPQALTRFKGDCAWGTHADHSDFAISIGFDQTQAPTSDVTFRRAVAKAIDRGDMVARLAGGEGLPGSPGFLPPDHPFFARVEQYTYDVAAANRMLDDAGYKRGPDQVRLGLDQKPIHLKFAAFAPTTQAAEVVKDSLKKIGVELEIAPYQAIGKGPQDAQMAIGLHPGLGGDPDIMRQIYSSRAPESTPEFPRVRAGKGYKNAQLDDLADQQLVAPTREDRKAILAKMQKIAADDLPVLYLYYPRAVFIFKRSAFDRWGSFGGLDKANLIDAKLQALPE